MSLENMGESQEIDRLIFTNRVKGCLTDRAHDLFRELDDNPVNVIARKMLFLAAFAPHPASFAPNIFTQMVNLTPDQANRILEIACG